jgi:hypothetical protein
VPTASSSPHLIPQGGIWYGAAMTITTARRFAFHYAEMVAVMFVGMGVLGGLGVLAFGVDTGEWGVEAALLGMTATMTLPMVPWMRFRGHGWGPTAEMGAAMVVPSLAAIAVLWAGWLEDRGGLMAIEHAGMFVAMFAVMLARAGEYTGHH